MHDLDLIRAEENDELFQEFDDETAEDGEFEQNINKMSSDEELELASELLEVGSEEELEEFLGKLVKRFGRGIRRFARSGVGRALGKGLKSIAKRVLPIAGSALGNLVAPGLGGAIGGRLGSAASNLFEMDSENMSDDEISLEMSRRFVRLAADATRRAASSASAAPARRVARSALRAAARRHAPGLLNVEVMASISPHGSTSLSHGGSGRWIRRGRSIVLLGA